MKKRQWIIGLSVALVLAVLFVPIPSGIYKDGGTRAYTALTYKVVVWNRIYDAEKSGFYQRTCVYWFPNNFKSIDVLWEKERHPQR